MNNLNVYSIWALPLTMVKLYCQRGWVWMCVQPVPGHSLVWGQGGKERNCAVIVVTLVSQRKVRKSDNGPSAPQGGLGVHRGLCVKQGVTCTRVPSKVLSCSQNKHTVHGSTGQEGRVGSRTAWMTRVSASGSLLPPPAGPPS